MKSSSSKGPSNESFVFKYTLSSVAALVAETVTYPLDLTKTRMQIQGEIDLHPKVGTQTQLVHRGMVHTAVGIVKEEGLLKLWQGVTPALYRHLVYTGCRMTFYEFIREKVLGRNQDGTSSLWKAIIGGVTAGALGQFVASPTDLVKVQMQMEGRRRLEGNPSRVKNAGQVFKNIVTEGGIRGLWRGWIPNVQRAALVNMGDLATYDTVKHRILKHTNLIDNYVTHMLSSACSGLVASLLGTPADVIKTRVMNQPTQNGIGMLYKGSIDCLIKTVRNEGFMALYKGFLPIWTRMAPWSTVFWVTYEQVRKFTGTSPF